MIQVYKEGNLVSSTSLSSQININTKKEYSLQLTGDLKPILNELTTTPTTPSPSPTLPTPTQPPSPTSPTLPVTSPIQSPTKSPSATTFPNLELIIIIIVIAATLASLVIVFRKYKAK
jgi:heme-binding NEAT domain protein